MYSYLEEVHPEGLASPAADQKRAVRVAASDTARLQRLAAARKQVRTPFVAAPQLLSAFTSGLDDTSDCMPIWRPRR